MGLGGINVWQLLIILVIVVLIFGTKKLKNIGGDIGGAVKNFKTAVKEEKEEIADNAEKVTEEVAEEAAETADKV